jgi:porin
MQSLLPALIISGLLGCLSIVTLSAEPTRSAIGGNDQDPLNLLGDILERRTRTEREALLPVSPLKPVHESLDGFQASLYKATHFKWGLTVNHLFQGMSDSVPTTDPDTGNTEQTDRWGTTTDVDLVTSWELFNVGQANMGQIVFHLEGRWDYGTTGPQDLGFSNLASAIGTGNAFSKYVPAFLIRNFYWEQGSEEAGWAFRAGKITPDAILATSQHITPVTTFLPNAGTGLFSSGYPDSGLGMVGMWYVNDRLRLLGLVSDSNGNRVDWGDIEKSDLYKAFEVQYKVCPNAKRAGFSKFTIWHSDGTYDGAPINASSGQDGWGMTLKHEQDLTADGRGVGVFRWGRSWDESAFYKQQAAAHFLLYDPGLIGTIKNDLVGTAFNWVKANDDVRDEYNWEIFYRFPFFPGLDTTVSYQSVWDPAFNTEFDHAHVVSLRLRTTF